jgi:hypothetical protein
METVTKWFQTELTLLRGNWGGGVAFWTIMSPGNFTNSFYRYIKAVFLDIMHIIFSCIIVLKVPRLVRKYSANVSFLI